MTRIRRLAAAMSAALIGGAIGCAHCDTCDEFPKPCLGADCAGGGMVPTSAPIAAAPMGLMGEDMPFNVTDVPAGAPMPGAIPAAPAAPAAAAPNLAPPPPIPAAPASPAAATPPAATTPPALPPALPVAPPADSPPLATPMPGATAP